MNIEEERRTDKISIIVPCYNEEACIEIVYAETAAAMEALTEKEQVSYEIIFVDDGSRDGTLKLLRELAAAHTREPAQVRYLSFSRNFGKEAAMLACPECTGSCVTAAALLICAARAAAAARVKAKSAPACRADSIKSGTG